jgi:hypothetical protein
LPQLDDLADLALSPETPRDERRDVNAEIWRDFGSQLTYPDLAEIREDISRILLDEARLQKATRLEPYFYDTRAPVTSRRRGSHEAVLRLNEYGIIDQAGYASRWMEKRTSGFYLLKDLNDNVDLLAAINFTWQRYLRPFARPERDEGPFGFRIERRDGEKMSKADEAEALRIETWLLNCGDIDDYFERKRLQRTDLDTFVSKLTMETCAADACPIELARTPAGKLSGMHNVDYATVRLCSEFGYEGRDEIFAVQLVDDIPHVGFSYGDLIYETRNERTDIYSGGYGFSEKEMALRAVTGYLNAVAFNTSGIDRNSTPRGILTFFGEYDQGQFEQAKRQLKLMLTGPGNRWHVPMFASKSKDGGAQWTPIDQFNEMMFARMLIFFVSIVCALEGIDPSVISFDAFTTRTSSLTGTDTAEKLALSRVKGLLPRLYFVENILDTIVKALNPRFRLKFVGIHQEDGALKARRLELSGTFDETRAMDGKDPVGDKLLGQAPVNNPALLQLYMQSKMAAEPQQEGGGQPTNGETFDNEGQQGAGGGEQGKIRGKEQPTGKELQQDLEGLAKAAVIVIERGAD